MDIALNIHEKNNTNYNDENGSQIALRVIYLQISNYNNI